MSRLGVFGGTFDPIHVGHLVLAETAREQLDLDQVIFVPTGQPWRKADRAVSPREHRLAMVRLAIADNSSFAVSAIEVEREGPSYSYETLDQLSSENPGAELFFVLGADALVDLPNWRMPGRILELATLAVAGRPEAGEPGELPGLGSRLVCIDMPAMAISSSGIRARASAGASIRYLVPPPVEHYIVDHRLY